MDDVAAVESGWTRSLRAGERPSPAGLREHLRAVHDARPGFTEACAGRCRDADGRNSYQWLAEAVPLGCEGVLDVACGSGVLLEECRRRLGEGADLAGLDMSASELALARGRLGPHVRLIEGVAQDMGAVAAASMGAVLCHWALTLMDPVEPVLAEMARVLAPGGVVAAIVDGDPASAPGYAEIDALIGDRVRRAYPAYGAVELGDPRVRDGAALAALARGAFPEAQVVVEPGLMMAEGPPEALAGEVVGFFYAAFVLEPEARAATVDALARRLGSGADGRGRFVMPINRLVVRDRRGATTA